MRTGIFEHFGNLNVKDDDFYWHGIGLKKIPKYSATFWVHREYGVIEFYRKDGSLLSTATLSHTNQTEILEVAFNPATDRAYFITRRPSSSGSSNMMEIVEVTTGRLVSTINMRSGNVTGKIDTSEKGSVYFADNGERKFQRLNKDGLIEREISTGSINIASPVSYWEKEKIVNVSSLGFYNPSNLTRIAAGTSGYIMSNGKIVQVTAFTVKFSTINWNDYTVISETTSIDVRPMNTHHTWRVRYLGEVNKEVYFHARNTTAGYEVEYVVVVSSNGSKRNILLNQAKNVFAIDKHFYYCIGNQYEVRRRTDQSLVVSLPPKGANIHVIGTTKGNYNNFKQYW